MKKVLIAVGILFIIGALVFTVLYKNKAESFQYDADVVRIEDVLYWSGLIEEYKLATGQYPLEGKVTSDDIILVRIATRQQQTYFEKEAASYKSHLDNNANGTFTEFPVREFVQELEEGLGRPIDEHYDIQRVPTVSPNWYNYFISEDGYLFWVTCQTCGVSWATTLLGDGYTPTINIGSIGVTEGASKLHTREEILELPDYQQLAERKLRQEDYIRSLQAQQFNDSKQN